MASGPEHYRQAEELLADANTLGSDPDHVGWCQRQAQAHATLALAAFEAALAAKAAGERAFQLDPGRED